MGRRRQRSDSDVDESLESAYAKSASSVRQRPRSTHPPADEGNKRLKQEATMDKIDQTQPKTMVSDVQTVVVESSAESSVEVKAKQQDRIEAQRRKKQERNQRKKEKRAEKKQQTDALQQSKQEHAKQEKKDKAAKKGDSSSQQSSFIKISMGVQYQDVTVGQGAMVPDRKKIRVAYTLRAKNRYGKILDSSTDFGFRLGRGEVIQGWDIGCKGMRQGGRRYLIIPPEAGYGSKNIGAGSGAVLFFDVTVLAC